jgi:phage tail sheath protein FI
MASFESAQKSPGVYVIEQPSAVKAIGGVGTSTAGFIGIKSLSTTIQQPAASEEKSDTETLKADRDTNTFDLRHANVTTLTETTVSASKTLAKVTDYTLDTTEKKIITFTTLLDEDYKVKVGYKSGGSPKEETFDKDKFVTTGTDRNKKTTVTLGDPADDGDVSVKLTVDRKASIEGGKLKLDKPVLTGFSFTVSYKYMEKAGGGSEGVGGQGQSTSNVTPLLFTNFTEFKDQPQFGNFDGSDSGANCLRHAVFGFFNNGGSRCYVVLIDSTSQLQAAVDAFAAIDEVALVAAPGLKDKAVQTTLINHCQKEQGIFYRFAILDGPKTGKTDSASSLGIPDNSKYAAFYFPWIKVFDPILKEKKPDSDGLLEVPPSGHIAGIYARVDAERGVHKAPANEAIRGALGVSQPLSKVEQGTLNDKGVNCIRVLNNQILVWGARTVGGQDNQDLKYVNVRRTLLFLRKSIDQGTQWVVFEPNTRGLWKKITRNVTAFLTDVWRSGALFGDTPQEAFYVRCDDETNPPSLREKGLVVTEIGVAIARPAEFVVFQISQFTAPA